MAWWSRNDHCAGWLCGVLIGNRWRKPFQALGRLDDGDDIRCCSPPWRRCYGSNPSFPTPTACNDGHWWTPAIAPKLYKPRVFDEALAALVSFLALRRVTVIPLWLLLGGVGVASLLGCNEAWQR
uniref:Uncharacterized protein n=1 Tax=Oryza punctata TaxID=4537 RepID=A0A0E0K2Y1_ORYPU